MSTLQTGRILQLVKGGAENEGHSPAGPDKVLDVLRGINPKEDPSHITGAARFLSTLEALRNEAA